MYPMVKAVWNPDGTITVQDVVMEGPNRLLQDQGYIDTRFDTEEQAKAMTEAVSAFTGNVWVYGRVSALLPYRLMEMYKVGDVVSEQINGDSYPCGVVTEVKGGKRMAVYTSTGERFLRNGDTLSWKRSGYYFLRKGYHDEQDPSF